MDDLWAAADYIARDSQRYAAALVEDAFERADSLDRFAERGHVVPEFTDTNLREVFVKKFRLIYQIQESDILVLGSVHGARDLHSLFEDRGG